MNIIVLSIPVYLFFIGVEWLVGRKQGRRIFRAPDMAANLMLGTAQTVFSAVAVGVLVGSYLLIYEHRIMDVSAQSPLAWVVLFIAQDFLYYWFHRASHRINLAWATHAPHHQSEDYNFAVALRQGPIQPLVSRLFYLPLALFGFPPAMFATVVGINTVYQFWLHTELVRSIGPLEWILNTPSHHRVHHGCNGRYLDKNHGAMLIVWDRLFGTFEPEGEKPVYGTVKPVDSFNPLVCFWAPFRDILNLARTFPRFVDKLVVWVMPPEWRPRGLPKAELEVSPDRPKFHVRMSRGASAYVFVVFFLSLGVVVYFVFRGASAPVLTKVMFTAWFVATVAGLGGVIEGRSWAKWLEAARIAAAPVVVWLL